MQIKMQSNFIDRLSEPTYKNFANYLQRNLGIVLGENRQYLVRSRLVNLAREKNYTDINTFLEDVIRSKLPSISEQCMELMTTNETFWFRDAYPFALLTNYILPVLSNRQNHIKIWCAACSSGQEPYSIAMTIREYQRKHPRAFEKGVDILASDFSSKMIAQASTGQYDDLALSRGLSNQLRQRYFDECGKGKEVMQINQQIQTLVNFKRFNLKDEFSSLGRFDVVFCRNVLIYFDGKQKAEVLKKIAACLPSGGSLMLGAAESITGSEKFFKMHTMDEGLYYSKQ